MARETPTSGIHHIETVIEGSPHPHDIAIAVGKYTHALQTFAYPKDIKHCNRLPDTIGALEPFFKTRVEAVTPKVIDIIRTLNERAHIQNSSEYEELVADDVRLWLPEGQAAAPLFGVLACVDKGIPFEAVVGIDGDMGRTLAGDLSIAYIRSKGQFVPVESALVKRFIHMGRQGHNLLIEPLIEHTGCGRRGQMLANEHGSEAIPAMGYIFEHIDALTSEFDGNETENRQKLETIKNFWLSLERQGNAVIAADHGLFAGIVTKIAQRQALQQLRPFIQIINPIKIFNKMTGDVIVGMDNLDILSDPLVLKSGGFTEDVLKKLAEKGDIFSLHAYYLQLEPLLNSHSPIKAGTHTYRDLQTTWLDVQKDLVSTTASLWKMYHSPNKNFTSLRQMVDHYLRATLNTKLQEQIRSSGQDKLIVDRLIHHLFHTLAYTHVLDTFHKGNVPGKHLEGYLSTGDYEIGTKEFVGLDQGDLDRPSAAEMFTGYSVLLHSTPGHEGTPIPVMIKLDTDRKGVFAMSTEETNVAMDDMHEFLKLWPYFLVGDMIPVLAIRGKHHGGISRLGLSILLSFGDITNLLERPNSPLPPFVPANTSQGEVVLVPAYDVLLAGIETQNDLKKFRNRMTHVADGYANPDVQKSFNNHSNNH